MMDTNQRTRTMKASTDLSAAKHIFTFWIITPIILVAGIAAIGKAIDMPPGELNSFMLIFALLGLGTGWFIGLVVYFFNRGIRGWIEVGSALAARRRQTATEDDFDNEDDDPGQAQRLTLAQAALDTPQAQAASPNDYDPWEGTNPYGCCQSNYDPNGRIHHGSSDCLHPAFVTSR